MGEPVRRKARYEDLVALPEHVVGEIIDGELIVSPRPRLLHARTTVGITGTLFSLAQRQGDGDGPGGWWILFEPELHLGNDILVPDVAGWRRERVPELPDEAFFTLAPDWACEVLSPGTVRVDRGRKKRIYARERVGHLWLVDPIAQTLEIYRLAGEFWLDLGLHEGHETVRVEPFEVLEIDLKQWWG